MLIGGTRKDVFIANTPVGINNLLRQLQVKKEISRKPCAKGALLSAETWNPYNLGSYNEFLHELECQEPVSTK